MSAEAAREIAEGNRLRQAGRAEDAIAAYRRAIALNAAFGDAHYNLGIALRDAGDLRGSALEFRAASRLDANDLDAVQNVIETIARAVERDEALFEPQSPRPPRERRPVSIVTCSIDEDRLAAMHASFRAGLGDREHEFVVIRDARSLSEGYQRGLDRARHPWVVFSHDDVELASDKPFDALERALDAHDIVGVAGSRLARGPAMAWAGQPHLFGFVGYPEQGAWKATAYSLGTGIVPGIQALDGLLFAARREAARQTGFDAATFDGFHLYDLDFVYRAFRAGLSVAVTTEVLAIHASEGSFDEAWRVHADRFLRKFPELAGEQGRSVYFGRTLARREQLVRFHAELNALGATP